MERRLRREKRMVTAFTRGMYYFRNGDTAEKAIRFAKAEMRWDYRDWTDADLSFLESRLIDNMYEEIKNRFEPLLKRQEVTLIEVEDYVEYHDECAPLANKLYELLFIWERIYKPKAAEGGQLAALANDNQNVHTGPVNKQTRISLRIMTSATVPQGQKTLDEILTAWVTDLNVVAQISNVYNDMVKWADTKSVVQDDDYLYRHALRGLWAMIKTYDGEIRLELTKRLWEECNEAVDMCAQGHLSRLANVLVGFDAQFKSPQSLKESLQNALGYISMQDSPLAEKIEKATAVMDEMGVPHEERQAWLDAF
jgi:hypothetical protein